MMEMSQSLSDQVWDCEVAYWEYLKHFDLLGFLTLWHDLVICWPNNQAAPMNKAALGRLVQSVLVTLQPDSLEVSAKRLSAHVVKDVVTVFLEVVVHALTKTGTPIEVRERMVHAWLQTDRGWQIIGGMAAPSFATNDPLSSGFMAALKS